MRWTDDADEISTVERLTQTETLMATPLPPFVMSEISSTTPRYIVSGNKPSYDEDSERKIGGYFFVVKVYGLDGTGSALVMPYAHQRARLRHVQAAFAWIKDDMGSFAVWTPSAPDAERTQNDYPLRGGGISNAVAQVMLGMGGMASARIASYHLYTLGIPSFYFADGGLT